MDVIILLTGGGVVASLAAIAVLKRRVGRPVVARARRASILDPVPERISLFSADHVRMLSESQLRALEQNEEETQ